jgi:nitroreductase
VDLSIKRTDAAVPLHPLLESRWSARAFDENFEIDDRTLRGLLEAARWAPSSGNIQPARYFVGRRGDPTFGQILDVLNPGNRTWAGTAAILLLGTALSSDEDGEPLEHTEYSVALGMALLTVQATAADLFVHQMAGFDAVAAHQSFALPHTARAVIAAAVGRRVEPDTLPDRLAERERQPRVRKPVTDLFFAEKWGKPLLDDAGI